MRNTLAKGAGVNSLLLNLIETQSQTQKPNRKPKPANPYGIRVLSGAKKNSAESNFLFKKNTIREFALFNS